MRSAVDSAAGQRSALFLAPAAGALLTLSLAPFELWPLGILSCLLFARLLADCGPRAAAWRGWLYGLGLFGSGASWVYVSIHVHGYASVPLALLLTALFCSGLALLPALFAWIYARWVRPLPGGLLVGFPALWVLFEWLRSWLLTGFPWLYLGNAHLGTPLAGWAPLLGVYGLSLLVALSACALLLAWQYRHSAVPAGCAILLLAIWGGGTALQSVHWVKPAERAAITVALYQPDILQERKWDPAWRQPILDQYHRAMDDLYGADIILWPESAIPTFYERAGDWLAPLVQRAEAEGTSLVTGVLTSADAGDGYYNSILSLGAGSGQYHKQRLVPFGEYIPLEGLLRGLIAFFDLPMSAFSSGPPNQPPLRAGGVRLAPYICYEIVYPDLVAASAGRSDLLVTISNDTWFGKSIGPLQHLEIARMRALENGRYMLRGTNNGVTALVDHRGRLLARSPQFTETILRGEVKVMQGRTPFSRTGSWPVLLLCCAALLLAALHHRRRR